MVWPVISAAIGIATRGFGSTLLRTSVSKAIGQVPRAMRYSRRIARYAPPVALGIATGDKAAKYTGWGQSLIAYLRKTSIDHGQVSASSGVRRRRRMADEYAYKY